MAWRSGGPFVSAPVGRAARALIRCAPPGKVRAVIRTGRCLRLIEISSALRCAPIASDPIRSRRRHTANPLSSPLRCSPVRCAAVPKNAAVQLQSSRLCRVLFGRCCGCRLLCNVASFALVNCALLGIQTYSRDRASAFASGCFSHSAMRNERLSDGNDLFQCTALTQQCQWSAELDCK